MGKIIGACGCICSDCRIFNKECMGCHSIEGIACWLHEVGLDICDFYECSVIERKLQHCGECMEIPCERFWKNKNPSWTEEQHKKIVEERVILLKELADNKDYPIELIDDTDYISNLRRLVGHTPLVLCTVGIMIVDDKNRILLQYRSDNKTWCPPGGIVELGESVEEAAKREAYEETGLIIEELKLFNIYSGKDQHYIYPNGDEVYFVNIVFITRKYQGKLCADGIESLDLKFFHIDSLPEEISSPVRPHLEDLRNRISGNSLFE